MAAGDGSTPKERLLDAVLEHLAVNGMQDTTLRGLAAWVGTSHRMLAYHFGSRRGLLVEVARTVERRQREAFAAMLADPEASPTEVMREMWHRFADSALDPHERLFFEIYARALRDPDGAEGFLPEAVEAWIPPVAELFVRLGFSRTEATPEARLAVAVSRGMLLDLLATGDRAAADAVLERYLARYESEGGARRASSSRTRRR